MDERTIWTKGISCKEDKNAVTAQLIMEGFLYCTAMRSTIMVMLYCVKPLKVLKVIVNSFRWRNKASENVSLPVETQRCDIC